MHRSKTAQLLLFGAALVVSIAAGLIGSAALHAGTPSESPNGGAQVIGPVILDSTQTSADVTVGRAIVFNVENPADWTLSADPAELVQLTPGGESGGATFNPGATALAAGSVTITLTNETSGEVLAFAISIK
jgi:hypothetical protein